MRQKIFTLLFAFMASIGSMYADAVKIGDLYYNLNESDKTAEVTYQNCEVDHNYRDLISVTIPSSVTYTGQVYAVTRIGNYAIAYSPNLIEVTIPSSITSIGTDAFFGDCSLNSVRISSLEAWLSISFNGLYSNPVSISHHLYLNDSEVTEVTIPNNMTSIGAYTFAGCENLTAVTIHNAVKAIEKGAFYGCAGLSSITIPSSVNVIGSSAFSGCAGLTSITIPSSVTVIESSVFSGCAGLTTITIPSSVKSIGDRAFNGCAGLTSINIPNSITTLGEGTFANCSALEHITLPKCLTRLGDAQTHYSDAGVFQNCTQLHTVELNDGLQEIGRNTFYKCTNLVSVQIPNTVTIIGDGAFAYSGLESVTIPGSVPCLGNGVKGSDSKGVFEHCEQLQTVVLNEGLETISYVAFADCINLSSINIPNSVTAIGRDAFKNCTSLPVVDNIRYAGTILVEVVDKTLSSYTIQPGTRFICGNRENGTAGFINCTNMTSISIPSSVISIGMFAFQGCTSLPIVDNIRYADTYLVEAVDKTLLTYSIKENTKWIGTCAFSRCSNLLSISIPESVSYIDYAAFRFCGALTSVTLPKTISSIEEHTFYDCSSLTSITIPTNVKSIGMSAFSRCTSLDSITIPEGVETLEMGAFYYCENLSSLTLPESLKIIGEDAFVYCKNLNSITIPKSIKEIGAGAFSRCSGLTSVTCKSVSLPTIGKNLFRDVDCSKIPLYVPYESVALYSSADQWKEFNPILAYNEAINNVISSNNSEESRKILHDGQVLIQSGDRTFTLTGQEVR